MMMPKIKNSSWVLVFCALLLSACSTPEQQPQYAQGAQQPAVEGGAMIETCKQEAAYRYNTREQQISVVDFKQYQEAMRSLAAPFARKGLPAHSTKAATFCTFHLHKAAIQRHQPENAG